MAGVTPTVDPMTSALVTGTTDLFWRPVWGPPRRGPRIDPGDWRARVTEGGALSR